MPSQAPKTLSARFFRWHRWLGWIVALQVLAWVAGGVVFTWLPFKQWVKAEQDVKRPAQPLPPNWPAVLSDYLQRHQVPPALSVSSIATAKGPALHLKHADSESWVPLDGSDYSPPALEDIRRFSQSLRLDGRSPAEVVKLASVPRRAVIVQEAHAAGEVWLATFGDELTTRMYFDGRSGALIAVRNDAWVLYDFFWRLHLMDYQGGEDFSHPLVKGASLIAFALVLTGTVLGILALRRTFRQRSRQAQRA